MNRRTVKGAVALGSLTAAVALLAGLGTAQAQIGAGQVPAGPPVVPTGPGAGSFPQSFLIPGTNTSLSLYGKISMGIWDNIGSQHTNDTSPSGGGATPFPINALAMEGPGAAGGSNVSNIDRSIHGGLRPQVKGTNFAFETRTPTDLGEVKTVMLVDFGLMASQNNYVGSTANKPSAGAGNNETPRIQWAYGTIGPWLIGQYNTAFSDPLLINPDIGDQSQIGPVQTANIRRPQIRYTYLAGGGLTVIGSVESQSTGATWCAPFTATGAAATCTGTAGAAPGVIGTNATDNLDVGGAGNGGINNWPTANVGVGFDQPWGHLMARAGVGRDTLRNGLPPGATVVGPFGGKSDNISRTSWAIAGGAMLNTFGQDQWRGLVSYSSGLSTYLTDLSATGSGDMFINGQTGQVGLIKELALNTSYIHRFSPNWRTTGEFGIGFFNKPNGAGGLTNCANSGTTVACVSGGATAAQLASLEKRHIEAAWSLTYSPLPGMVDIALELDYYDRRVQASGTGATAWVQRLGFNFYW